MKKLIVTVTLLAALALSGQTALFAQFMFYNGAIVGYTGPGGNVVIPAAINGQPVTEIGMQAFSGRQLTGVTIPNSVTIIDELAFYKNQLASVTIGNSVTAIGDSVFYYNRLTSVTIPNSVASIGKYAFYGSRLTSVTIPNSITTIEIAAFGENQLASVTIPNRGTTIGAGAFAGSPLTSVTIPANVNIGNGAFDQGFTSYYNTNGKKAGTYTLNGSSWSYRSNG